MDDDSFDPRNWARPVAPPPKTTPSLQQSETASRIDALPEAWAEVSRTSRSIEPLPDAAPARLPAPRKRSGYLLWGLSAAILSAGASAAWFTRTPAVKVAEAPATMAAATATLTAQPGSVERSLNLKGAGEIAGALTDAGLSPQEATAAAQAAAGALHGSGDIRAVIVMTPLAKGYQLERLQASYADGSGAVVARNEAGGFSGTVVAAELTKQVKVLRGELDSESFYTSAVAAGVTDTLIPEFINAFSFDFNLAAEVHPGDTFEVAYEQSVNASGEPFGQPQLLYASLTTAEKSLALYRFVLPGGEIGWYDGNGGSTKRGLMRTPVDGARITSNFGMRFHPVLHYTRLHAGVDFGVPVGTPVFAAADGVVIGATPTGCGGNMAVLQHDNGWVTRYFHLSHYAPGLHDGQRVIQGETIGLSGTTGTCTTGPHLHYELRINGEPVDPMSVPMDDKQKKKLEPAAMQAFIAQRNRVDVARSKVAM